MANAKLYDCIYKPTHHRASDDGMVYKHIIVAEEALGRPLIAGETVHHIDHNKKNNKRDNLLVFCSNSAHARFHKYNCSVHMLVLLSNGSYDCANPFEEDLKCPVCGKRKYRKAMMCNTCRLLERRKNTPSREELKVALQSNNYNLSATGRFYGVSSTAVKKWCKNLDLNCKNADVV